MGLTCRMQDVNTHAYTHTPSEYTHSPTHNIPRGWAFRGRVHLEVLPRLHWRYVASDAQAKSLESARIIAHQGSLDDDCFDGDVDLVDEAAAILGVDASDATAAKSHASNAHSHVQAQESDDDDLFADDESILDGAMDVDVSESAPVAGSNSTEDSYHDAHVHAHTDATSSVAGSVLLPSGVAVPDDLFSSGMVHVFALQHL